MNAPNLTLIEAISAELADYRDDDEAFWTTLDGETDAVDLIDTFLAGAQDDDALADAIARQIDELAARAKRIEDRARAKRRTLGLILNAAGMKKAERPRGTVSVRPGNLSVRIVAEEDIPSQLMREKITRAPDKAAIKAQIEAGERVPGAELVRGDDVVTIRVA
jgi:hypothetical protein